MTNEARKPNDESPPPDVRFCAESRVASNQEFSGFRASNFVILSSFDIHHSTSKFGFNLLTNLLVTSVLIQWQCPKALPIVPLHCPVF
jgi:hypothetical protein